MSIPVRCFRTHSRRLARPYACASQCISELGQWHQQSSITTTSRTSAPSSSATDTTDLKSSQADSTKRVIFSGIQPTGIPHLGNYLGALQRWVSLQNEATPDDELTFSIVDLHALTVPQDPKVLREWRRQSFAVILAVGLDPERVTVFFQSAVPAHSELMWILSTVSSMGYLSRMTQWKSKLHLPESSTLLDKSAREKLRLGLFSYPVLQAADVLVHGATHVPVGEDQKQHLEFAREVANSFNYLYGPVLTLPDTLISPAKRIMSLKSPDQKMSKSHSDPNSRILLTDTPDVIERKIKSALTDSEAGITYDPVRRPGVSNLLEILSHVDNTNGQTPVEIAQQYEQCTLKALKEDVARRLVNHLSPIREGYLSLMSSGGDHLDQVAQEGGRKPLAMPRRR